MLPRRCTRRGAAGFAPLSFVAREGGSQLSVDTLGGRISGSSGGCYFHSSAEVREWSVGGGLGADTAFAEVTMTECVDGKVLLVDLPRCQILALHNDQVRESGSATQGGKKRCLAYVGPPRRRE
jgi:hypothetical protein